MSKGLAGRAAALFEDRFGASPHGVAFAPGRVNLIGEHVDYNDGLVLPMPVLEGTAIAWAPAAGQTIEVVAADFGEEDRFDAASPAPPDTVGWRSYVRGMVAEANFPCSGLRLLVTGNLQRGAGLSSSASLCVALGRALAGAAGATPDPVALAKAAQRTEHAWAGVACGIMDQMAVAAGKAGHAMLLDCRDLSCTLVPVPADWAVAVVESGVTRGLVDGEYNLRRAQCETAARALGVTSLRDASLADLGAAQMPELEHKRARHVIGEIARTTSAAEALRSGDLAGFGAVLAEGHASLRDLFDVSVPPVDALVERLAAAIGSEGGARMTGGGFGGAVVAVLRRSELERVARETGETLLRAY
jgi:galactokinase